MEILYKDINKVSSAPKMFDKEDIRQKIFFFSPLFPELPMI